MSKVMLVEDDDSLREIYSIRLTAEGYTIVTAKDGEEALAVAVRERPDLIVSDVMMPKISGFDMLDILRSTPETQNIKVIMMTALSSEDQRVRGESLGADRYLVKSQVGIEDVVNVVHDVLGDRAADGTINPSTPANDVAMPAVAETVIEVPPQCLKPRLHQPLRCLLLRRCLQPSLLVFQSSLLVFQSSLSKRRLIQRCRVRPLTVRPGRFRRWHNQR